MYFFFKDLKKKIDSLSGEELQVRLNPSLSSNKILVDIEQSFRELLINNKKTLFELNRKLQDKNYAIEFQKLGGMKFLVNKIPEFTGNTLAYALQAVHNFTHIILNTKQTFTFCPQHIKMLFFDSRFKLISILWGIWNSHRRLFSQHFCN
jgi:hypothetical protein